VVAAHLARPHQLPFLDGWSTSESTRWILLILFFLTFLDSALGVATDVPSSRSSWPSVRVTTPRPEAFVEYLSYRRYARSMDMMSTDDASAVGMVRIGFNLYYCNWCAKMVGYNDANAFLGCP